MIKKNLKLWEEWLPHIEFAYNYSVHSSTYYCPFEVVYGFVPLCPLYLSPLLENMRVDLDVKKKADFIRKLHKKVHMNIEQKNSKVAQQANKGYVRVIFEPVD